MTHIKASHPTLHGITALASGLRQVSKYTTLELSLLYRSTTDSKPSDALVLQAKCFSNLSAGDFKISHESWAS